MIGSCWSLQTWAKLDGASNRRVNQVTSQVFVFCARYWLNKNSSLMPPLNGSGLHAGTSIWEICFESSL